MRKTPPRVRLGFTGWIALVFFSLPPTVVKSWAEPPPDSQPMRAARGSSADSREALRKQISALLQRGAVAEALKQLRDHLASQPGDKYARWLLGRGLDFDGQPEDAVLVWQAGLTKDKDDFSLLMAIGDLRERQGKDGPNVSYHGEYVTYGAKRLDEKAEQAYKSSHLNLAVEAFRQAQRLAPEEPAPTEALAKLYETLGGNGAAAAQLERLAKQRGDDPAVQIGWGRVLLRLGRSEEGARALERALTLNPRSAEAYQLLAEQYQRNGQPKQASHARQQAAFYDWMPAFIPTVYDEEVETLFRIVGTEQPKGAAQTARRAKIRALLKNPSPLAAQFLAAICWHHRDHGDLETRAFSSLETRSSQGEALLASLIQNAGSTCTARQAAMSLARMKSPRALSLLLPLLPGDHRPFFAIHIAEALAMLGDAQAVPQLVDVLNPGYVDPVGERTDEVEARMGRTFARGRAALALGAFPGDECKKALRACLNAPEIALYCHAALYRMTQELQSRDAIAAGLAKDSPGAPDVALYLEKVATAEAKALVKQYQKRHPEYYK